MARPYPQRHRSHVLADESERFLRERLPQDWLVYKPQHDYGQDLRIELTEDGLLKGCELVVQVKASETPSESPNFETIGDLKTSTYNYLKRLLPVVMFVKYVRSEREAYWILLSDVPPPTDNSQATMTVRIPRANRLSALAWDWVAAKVRKVTDCKLKKSEGLTVFVAKA